ncbi:MAG: hypothetical protein IJL82_03085 [Prevotella sp.]|nr:hypothetical protein [Prevotella sp.]
MKQTIFETRQRADELMREAINIWRQSDMNDFLEGLETDPVLSLMLTALAYQMNEAVGDMEMLKTEVLEEYAYLLTPYEVGHAVPATAVIETALQDTIPEMELTPQSEFTLTGTPYTFIPVLRSRVMNAKVRSIVRMDGRRWKVSLLFKSPVSEISGLTFAVRNVNFQDVKVTIKGQLVPLVKPWDFADLPLSQCFGLDTILYNRSQTYQAQASCLDLFARQNIRLFYVKPHAAGKLLPAETETVDLVFEFTGISDRFQFDKESFSLNTVLLANAKMHSVTLSAASPLARVAGYDNRDDQSSQQFLHAIRPSEEQIYGNSLVEVRRVAADRFNQGQLVRLLHVLIAKYHSDYYAFQDMKGISGDKTMQALQEILSRLLDAAQKDKLRQLPGVYILLRDASAIRTGNGSVDVSYMTTAGANVNAALNSSSTFTVPTGFNSTDTRQIAIPVPGSDEVSEEGALASLSRYYVATCDRIVTPADIKVFCYNELLTRYGIVRDMVSDISVSHRQQIDNRECGYEIVVEILLADNSFVKRSFADKIPQVEILLQKMIEVRSTNIYPIHVSIQIK